jgi:hypothetical protein
MPGEMYNPNPTVFSPTKHHGRKLDTNFQSIWLNASPEGAYNAEEVEPIDQDEVFGMPLTIVFLTRILIHFLQN